MFLAQLATGPSALVANLPIAFFSLANSCLITPFDANLNPFMNPGPYDIARLITWPLAEVASVTIMSAVAAFSSFEAPLAICWASATPLRPVRIPDSAKPIASQMMPITLRTRATAETAAPSGGKIRPSKPTTVSTMPSLVHTLPTTETTFWNREIPFMTRARPPCTLEYGFSPNAADISFLPRKPIMPALALSIGPSPFLT